MRGFSAARGAIGLALVALLSQGAGAEPLSEVTGNWAGSGGGGFHFRAMLEGAGDSVTLTILNGIDGVPPRDSAPDLTVPDFALSAFATNRLEVVESPDGSILQVVTDFADETGEGREVVSVQFLDFQFTVTGYSFRLAEYVDGGGTEDYMCEVDLLAGKATGGDRIRDLPPMDFTALNASGWHHSAAFDRGWCSSGD